MAADTKEPANVSAGAVRGKYAYAIERERRLHVIDLSDPANPRVLGRLTVTSGLEWATRPAISGNYVLHNNAEYMPRQIVVSGTNAFVAGIRYPPLGRLDTFDVSDPTKPRLLSKVELPNPVWDVAVAGHYAYLAGERLLVLDVSDPANPRRVSQTDRGGTRLALSGDYLYINGSRVPDISDPVRPGQVGKNSSVSGQDLSIHNGNLFAAGPGGLSIVRLFEPLRLSLMFNPNPTEFRFQLTGGFGQKVQLQRSSNPEQWTDWKRVALGESPLDFSDPEAASARHYFYRALTR